MFAFCFLFVRIFDHIAPASATGLWKVFHRVLVVLLSPLGTSLRRVARQAQRLQIAKLQPRTACP